ncbi:class I lanthipeptide [uncultured Lacinutrix sp.]|nr:class I lanthipeptide [uncultured Lacinutrix sp.]
MKTQNTKLVFKKNVITELTDLEIYAVNGGTSFLCSNCMTVTVPITIK